MASLVVRLDPACLHDANLDLRYDIPTLLEKKSEGIVRDDGYDYEPETEAMHIYLWTSDLERALPYVIDLLQNERLFGNDLAAAATVGVCDLDAEVAEEYRIVFPSDWDGVIKALGFA